MSYKYKDALKFLNSFINHEKNLNIPYKDFSLKKVKDFFKLAGVDLYAKNIIHIAGTKGKGSTAVFLANILSASGYKTGLYTSPHLLDIRERMQVLNKGKAVCISRKKFTDIIFELKKIMRDKKKKPTYFEFLTAIAMKFFEFEKVDFIVLETGMGGRLDATNVFYPVLAIITNIGLDHLAVLGKTLPEIAHEKAGIIKRKIPVISAKQKSSVIEVIKSRTIVKKSFLMIGGKDFKFNVKPEKYGKSLVLIKMRDCELIIKLGDNGLFQAENVSLAVCALEYLIKEKKIIKKLEYQRGIDSAYIPGRFNVLSKDPLIIVDGAHNPMAFKALSATIKQYFPLKKIILIFAASKDKDILGMFNKIKPYKLILTRTANPRAAEVEYMADLVSFKDPVVASSVKDALPIALNMYNKDALILFAGSMFLAGEALKEINKWQKR